MKVYKTLKTLSFFMLLVFLGILVVVEMCPELALTMLPYFLFFGVGALWLRYAIAPWDRDFDGS